MPVTLRPMTARDLPLLAGWLAQPHVAEWWQGEPSDLPAVRANYAGHLDGSERIHMTVILLDDRPVGWLEWYWLRDHLDYAEGLELPPDGLGVDLAVGEPAALGAGVGRAALAHLCAVVVPAEAPTARHVFIDPDPANQRAIRCYTAAGFTPTGDLLPDPAAPGATRLLLRLDLP